MGTGNTVWGGVYPAPICPMNEDQSIDHPTLERYSAWLASHPGVSGLVVNGNAGEVTLLSDEEALDVVRTTRAAVPRSVRVVTGIVADSTVEAVREALDAVEAARQRPPELGLREQHRGVCVGEHTGQHRAA